MIITTVLQVLLERLELGKSLPEAIAAPRASQRNTAMTARVGSRTTRTKHGRITLMTATRRDPPTRQIRTSALSVVVGVSFGAVRVFSCP